MKKIYLLLIILTLTSCFQEVKKESKIENIKETQINQNIEKDFDLVFSDKLPKFSELAIDFEHKFNKNYLAFLG
jgi:hypothetical protein